MVVYGIDWKLIECVWQILVYGKGEASGKCDNVETFIWQLVSSGDNVHAPLKNNLLENILQE